MLRQLRASRPPSASRLLHDAHPTTCCTEASRPTALARRECFHKASPHCQLRLSSDVGPDLASGPPSAEFAGHSFQVNITLLSGVVEFPLKLYSAARTTPDQPHQPRLHRVQHPFPRNTKSFF